jgi:hypothetical protein
LTEESTIERPVLQLGTGSHGLHRRKRKPLFREERRPFLHSRHGPCHQSPTVRRRIAALGEIWGSSPSISPEHGVKPASL